MKTNRNKLDGSALYVEITKRNNMIFEIEHSDEPQSFKNSKISWYIYKIAVAIGKNDVEVNEIFQNIQNGFIKSGVIQPITDAPTVVIQPITSVPAD